MYRVSKSLFIYSMPNLLKRLFCTHPSQILFHRTFTNANLPTCLNSIGCGELYRY